MKLIVLPMVHIRREGHRLVVTVERCCVCEHGQPGLMELSDGRFVHRWPCRERLEFGA